MVNAQSVGTAGFHRDDRRRFTGGQLGGLGGGGGLILSKGHHAHAQWQFLHGVQVFVNMQAYHGGALFNGLHTVAGADDDRLGVECHDQCAGQQHGADRAVHLRHTMWQQNKSNQNVHQVVFFYAVVQHLGGVHRQRLASKGAAACIQNAADTVAAGVEVHQRIEVFAYIAFFQFIAGHTVHPLFNLPRWFFRCR